MNRSKVDSIIARAQDKYAPQGSDDEEQPMYQREVYKPNMNKRKQGQRNDDVVAGSVPVIRWH